ncbi:hypothetical protein 2 [Hubei picorna-like virus 14]|uniref:hypothetical protein 2 n=1 Tax=Hubei picorna-like virus 14 TaxID=1923093 RepID=UPI00090979C3|nr:hypothetical protein 2 [Hubei picorna-like virus 14]APG77975.1 hypothetical protein 2 [Hubei picorna-like virus 14]
MPGSFLRTCDDGYDHSITSFLQRPIDVSTKEWKTTHGQGIVLDEFKLPDCLIDKPMYKRKLDYMLGLRCDVQVRVQVNAQPFHAGRLLLVWIPFTESLINRTQYYMCESEDGLVPFTGCPHVDLDLSNQTEATMNIPFISPRTYFDLPNRLGNFGEFKLVVYSPLVDVVSTGVVEYTVWMNMTNVTVAFPTGKKTSYSEAQIGDEGSDQVKSGVISETAGTVAKALRLFDDVPMVSQFTRPAAWIASTSSDIAKLFGWSKPYNPSDYVLIRDAPGRFMANSDGSDVSENVSVIATNEIQQNPGFFRTDVDEMSIAHVVRRPNYVQHFQWKKGQAANTILLSLPINPQGYFRKVSDKILAPTHLMYLTNAFTYWRGGMNFTFKFIKTKFHSGRVRILFVPGDYSDGVSLNDIVIDANYSTVVDLRSETDVTYNVPYTSCLPWLNINGSTFNAYTSVGRLYVIVQNELVNSSSVSDTINVLVEVAGASDFEVAIPTLPHFYPVDRVNRTRPANAAVIKNGMTKDITEGHTLSAHIPTVEGLDKAALTVLARTADPPAQRLGNRHRVKRTVSDTFVKDTYSNGTILDRLSEAQVGGEESTPPVELASLVVTDTQDVGGSIDHTDFEICANTMGEKIVSIRQILKQFHVKDSFSLTVDQSLRLSPDKITPPFDQALTYLVVYDYYDYFSYLYAFRRGGMRTKIIPDEPCGALLSHTPRVASCNDKAFKAVSRKDSCRFLSYGTGKHSTAKEVIHEYQHPFYSMYPFVLNSCPDLYGSGSIESMYTSAQQAVWVTAKGQETPLMCYRAVSDDFTMGVILGAPFIIALSTIDTL